MTTDALAPDARHPGADYLEALYELEEEGFPTVQAEVSIRALQEVMRVEQAESEGELKAESRVEVMA